MRHVLDYVHAATKSDRRYLLFCAVQKAKVSTEGLKVMALLQECIGAKGFERDTYFEMALRDVQLIPSLEGSMHINLGLATQFMLRYFDRLDPELKEPLSLVGGEIPSRENPYLTEARPGSPHAIAFPHFQNAYRPLAAVANVALFSSRLDAFREAVRHRASEGDAAASQTTMALGQCFATIAYGQLLAEQAVCLKIPEEMISNIFRLLVTDLSTLALQMATMPHIPQMIKTPQTSVADWDFSGNDRVGHS